MAETGNYQLNQWEKTDRIQMEDFNADNAKIEAALAGLAEQVAAKADRSELPWVKIGETTLTAAAETATVTIPNPEQYRQIQMTFSTGGCKYLYLTMDAFTITSAFSFDSVCDNAIGFATLVTGYQTGYYMDCSVGIRIGTTSYGRDATALSPTYILSGSTVLGLRADGGSLNAGTHIDIYGLKK